MQKTMLNIFDFTFWFDLTPVRMGSLFSSTFFVVFAGLIIAAASMRIAKRNAGVDKAMKRFLENFSGKATTWGILGFLWLFFSFEEISFFGSRFWFLLWAIGVALASRKLWIHWKKEMPEERLRRAASVAQHKYIPRRSR
jgi:phosphatidylserine synthase